ncbi:MAG: HlyD family secretion protein [Candidatus Gastranaerophilales bacterium]|nr:HlyD family secretion protein [Candidatus Gastranaerophilales bacterium]
MADENNTVENENNEQERKKRIGIKRRYMVIILIVLGILIFLYARNASMYQSTDDAYVETHMVQVAPKVTGQIVELHVQDNQRVKEGDVVAVIDQDDYRIKFEQQDAEYQKELANQKVATANLSAVTSEIELAKKDLERYTNLYESGAVSKQTLDNAKTKYDSILARKTRAEESIFSASQNKVADANLKVLKAKRDKAELDLKNTKVIAPQNGTVTNKRAERGAYVGTGSPLFALVTDEVWVVANFKESQVGNMKPGQPVEIKIDTYPNKTFKGKVDSIQRASGAKSSLFPPENAVGSFVKIVQRIPVKIVFDEKINPEEYTIVSGMSVVPKVKVK